MDRREFAIEYPDYRSETLLDTNNKIADKHFLKRLVDNIQTHSRRLQDELPDIDQKDYSVYTGVTGIAMLFAKMDDYHDVLQRHSSEYLQMALAMIKRPLRHPKGSKATFLCGDAGPLAVGAVWYNRVGNVKERQKCVEGLSEMVAGVCSSHSIADEHLVGRAGFLYALLYVRQQLGEHSVKLEDIREVFNAIIHSGRSMSKAQHWQSPLLYEWHDSKYLGAAHGLSGIFYTLLQAAAVDSSLQSSIVKYVVPSIDYLMSLKFPSGNYPSSIGSSGGDKLIHWCHGAPGWIHMFVQAYKILTNKETVSLTLQLLGDVKYLVAARSCAEVIWRRGLLRKGYGLCHGVAGNGYAFLLMFNLTGEEKYLYWAIKFAEWCFDYGKHGCRTPDRPYSLFEGLAGTIYYWVDLLGPKNAKFPGFEL